MLVPVKWLKDYVKIDNTTREIAEKVTDSGSHVESIASYDQMSGLVVAKILDIRKHENSKNLQLVDLDNGQGKETVITGAKNMKVGDFVVLAQLGAKLPGGIEIKEVEFQGFVSKGMLCSYEELGVSENTVPKKSEEGIIILPNSVKAGDDAIKALDLDDQIIEFEITPNRPDCLSIIGMAREVAAVFDTKIQEPNLDLENLEGSYEEYFKGVEVKTDKTMRFMTAVVKDVEIKESPLYIQNYLRNAGMRPINNIVDFTNFIMLEYGQPLHAYDLDLIEGEKLIVRQGNEGESLKTLDEKERTIKAEDIVIADGNSKAIGLAGVMGGFETEVTENTRNILIESANFDSEAIRKTSKRLGLRSEASSRYEKGISSKLAEYGIKRFLKLIEETNSGSLVEGIHDGGSYEAKDQYVKVRNSRLNSLLGLDLSVEESKKYLEELEFKCQVEGDEITAKIPYFRSDVSIEADLIEEVGRLYGFHNIEPKGLEGPLTQGKKSDLRNFMDKIRDEVYGLGFSEVVSYSFISPKQYDKLNLSQDSKLRDSLKILNPLGEDFSVMRTTLMGNMLDIIRRNINNKQNNLRLSELGNSFVKAGDEPSQTKEEKLLVMALVGGEYDYYYLKDSFEKLLSKLGIEDYKFQTEENNPSFHPGRTANVLINDEKIAVIGEVHPLVLDNFDINKRVYLLEANIDSLFKYANDNIQYKEISKYPLVDRDIAFIINDNIEAQDIIETIKNNGGENIKFVKLFDRYAGSQIEDGKVSLAFKIGFQSNRKTLKDDEIKAAFNKIVDKLEDYYDIDLRS